MIQTNNQQRDNNPVVVATIIVMALCAMLILAYNFFVPPDRVTDLNPVGKQGARSAAPQSAPPGANDNNTTSKVK
jgi:hypothetical protein